MNKLKAFQASVKRLPMVTGARIHKGSLRILLTPTYYNDDRCDGFDDAAQNVSAALQALAAVFNFKYESGSHKEDHTEVWTYIPDPNCEV